MWHFSNAHEVDGTIHMDFPRWNSPGFLTPGAPNACIYVHAELSPDAGTISMHDLHTAVADFPRIDDRLTGQAQRYAVLTASSGSSQLEPGEHDLLARVDHRNGEWVQFDTEGAVGEAVFAPRPGSTDELDGYYLAFVSSFADDRTTLGIWDAADFPGPPRARVHLPQRVPNGLHGNWFAAD